jgi:hypothetical protein
MCWLSSNLGASTSWNPQSMSRPVIGLLYLYITALLRHFRCDTPVVFSFFFFGGGGSQSHHLSLTDFVVSPSSCGPEVYPTSEVGTPMRRSYVVPMRWMVIYKYGVPGGAFNPSSTTLPRPWSPWESSSSRKNSHGKTGNRTRDLMISSQKLWPLDHELAGLNSNI